MTAMKEKADSIEKLKPNFFHPYVHKPAALDCDVKY